jgi:hypothetical protein
MSSNDERQVGGWSGQRAPAPLVSTGLSNLRRGEAMRHVMALVALVGVLGLGQVARAQDAQFRTIGPGQTHSIPAMVFAGQWTEVGVVGKGDTDLDLYVYDPVGRLVGYDDDPGDDCLVRFFAVTTGTYTIKVVNRSNFLSNTYVIAIR